MHPHMLGAGSDKKYVFALGAGSDKKYVFALGAGSDKKYVFADLRKYEVGKKPKRGSTNNKSANYKK